MMTRTLFLFACVFCIPVLGWTQGAAINTTGSPAHSSAMLDVSSDDKGLLIPRVHLNGLDDVTTIQNPAPGLIVFNLNALDIPADAAPGGFYVFNSNNQWELLSKRGTNLGDMLYWDGSKWITVPAGIPGQYLQMSFTGVPVWSGDIFPILSTYSAFSILGTYASVDGEVTNDGGETIGDRGFCWNTTGEPTLSDNYVVECPGCGIGYFTATLNNLSPQTTYYVRSFASNSIGTGYGNEISFTTPGVEYAQMTTWAAYNVLQLSAMSGVDVTDDGGSAVTEGGICWSTSPNPTLADSYLVGGSGLGSYGNWMTGLLPGTTYYVRGFATNSAGTAYGNEEVFTTLELALPTVVTTAVTQINSTSGRGNGFTTHDGGSEITVRGMCWSLSPNPTTDDFFSTNGVGIGNFAHTMSGLTLGNTYYVRAYATNSTGTGYGEEVSFTTVLAIGDTYQGGKVAYILNSGDPGYISGETHGIIAAPSDQSTGAIWGCYGTDLTGAGATAIGSSYQNTSDIISGCATAGIAARLCRDLTLGGYSDWSLPSHDEFAKLHINRVAIGGFSNATRYWSSSETGTQTAFAHSFADGNTYTWSQKDQLYRVRAVRKF